MAGQSGHSCAGQPTDFGRQCKRIDKKWTRELKHSNGRTKQTHAVAHLAPLLLLRLRLAPCADNKSRPSGSSKTAAWLAVICSKCSIKRQFCTFVECLEPQDKLAPLVGCASWFVWLALVGFGEAAAHVPVGWCQFSACLPLLCSHAPTNEPNKRRAVGLSISERLVLLLVPIWLE